MKVVEEEQRKEYKKALKKDASPMDTYILRSSAEAPLTSGNFPLDEIRLGLFTPSKAHKVENPKTFRFEKTYEKIVQQQTKKLSFIEKYPLSIFTETTVT
jgi:hypothetical protein